MFRNICFLLALILIFALIWAGTTGKITGIVEDSQTGEPIMAADVELINPATGEVITGTSTDLEGYYNFLDVRPGVYDLRASSLGYPPVTVKNVVVHSDKTTEVNFELTSEAIRAEAIEIVAEREQIKMDAVSSEDYVSSEDIETMPVQSVNEILETRVGVVSRGGELHFRGGRQREVAYYVNGIPANDPTYGYRSLDVSTGAVQEIQVQTGAFNAEYGGALSAIVSIITKEGDPNKWAGSIGYSTTNFRVDALNKFTTNSDRLDFTLSGPEPISTYFLPVLGLKMPRDKRISYFLSITGENTDTRLAYNRVFDLDYEEGGAPIATQEEIYGPYNIEYGWFGFFPERRINQYQMTLKLKQRLTPSFKYVLSFDGNWSKWRSFDWYFYYCPKFSYKSKQSVYQMSLNVTHNLSVNTFYELKFGYFHNKRTLNPGDWDPGDFAVDSSAYRTLDDWVDVNGDGVPQIRVQWVDFNGNGMWDYGEYWEPIIDRIDTIWHNPGLRDSIVEIDTVYADTLPPQPGEEPWMDWNGNGAFEPRWTNFNSPYPTWFSMNIPEPYMDGEPFLDGYPYGLDYEALLNGTAGIEFVMETLWVDVNENGVKDFGEYVYGSYYHTPDTVLVEEYTWIDENANGEADWGEYIDINGDGQLTYRDGQCNYYDANGNGDYDVGELGEPFLDLNGNGYYDGPNYIHEEYEPYMDRNGNGKFDDYSSFQYRGFDQWAVWHKRTVDIALAKGDLTSQINKNNLVKTGLEFQWIRMDMNEIQYPEYIYDGVPDNMPWSEHGIFRSFYTRTPKTFAAYVQDKMEYGGLIANVGLRLDMFIQAEEVLEDSVEQELRVVLADWWDMNKVKTTDTKISPRLGMSYPITDKSKLFFSYGHFYQLPGFDNFYQTPTQGSRAGRLLGNPNLSYEKTVAYELGVAYGFAENWTVQFSGYYKDIYDLLNTSHARIGVLEQDVYVNHDYARSRGVEFRLDKSLSNYWSLNANYSYSFAFGKSSSDRSGYDAQFEQTAIPLRDLPLDWDQRHLVNVVLDFRVRKDEHPKLFGLTLPDQWGINTVLTWGSGFPYTPSKYNPHYEIKVGEKAWERTNALRMPNQFNVDMKINKEFKIGRFKYSAYLQISNLTNYRNVLEVYSSTGEPDKSWIFYNPDGSYELMGDDYAKDPTHWGPPTDIRLGINIVW
ncbi:hypothetical protein DRQ33_01890 [bacterium]|nr:MAG: hypothetical protein DRQ33_01890 [bacterium]